ncbi:hypothetical protein O5D80_005262 [Batrachochytrium dendrobatidis]|nr:hypothetical protein O5D80_005262 [Batrachochytrium dendrobatidis]
MSESSFPGTALFPLIATINTSASSSEALTQQSLLSHTALQTNSTLSLAQEPALTATDIIRFYDRIIDASDRKLTRLNTLGSKAKSEGYRLSVRLIRQNAWYQKMHYQLTLPPVMMGDSLSASFGFSQDFWDTANTLMGVASSALPSAPASESNSSLFTPSTDALLESITTNSWALTTQFDTSGSFLDQSALMASQLGVLRSSSCDLNSSPFETSVFGSLSAMQAEMDLAFTNSTTPFSIVNQLHSTASSVSQLPHTQPNGSDNKTFPECVNPTTSGISHAGSFATDKLMANLSFANSESCSTESPKQGSHADQFLKLDRVFISAAGSGVCDLDNNILSSTFSPTTTPCNGVIVASFPSSVSDTSLPDPPVEPAEGVMPEIPHLHIVEHHTNIAQESLSIKPLSPESFHPKRGSPLKDASAELDMSLPSSIFVSTTPLSNTTELMTDEKFDWLSLNLTEASSTAPSTSTASSATTHVLELSDTPTANQKASHIQLNFCQACPTLLDRSMCEPSTPRLLFQDLTSDESSCMEVDDSSFSLCSSSTGHKLGCLEDTGHVRVNIPENAMQQFISTIPRFGQDPKLSNTISEDIPLVLSLSKSSSILLGKRRNECQYYTDPIVCGSENDICASLAYSVVPNSICTKSLEPLYTTSADACFRSKESFFSDMIANILPLSNSLSETRQDKGRLAKRLCIDVPVTLSAPADLCFLKKYVHKECSADPATKYDCDAMDTDEILAMDCDLDTTCEAGQDYSNCTTLATQPTNRVRIDSAIGDSNDQKAQCSSDLLDNTSSSHQNSIMVKMFCTIESDPSTTVTLSVRDKNELSCSPTTDNIVLPVVVVSKTQNTNRNAAHKRLQNGSSYPSPPDPN